MKATSVKKCLYLLAIIACLAFGRSVQAQYWSGDPNYPPYNNTIDDTEPGPYVWGAIRGRSANAMAATNGVLYAAAYSGNEEGDYGSWEYSGFLAEWTKCAGWQYPASVFRTTTKGTNDVAVIACVYLNGYYLYVGGNFHTIAYTNTYGTLEYLLATNIAKLDIRDGAWSTVAGNTLEYPTNAYCVQAINMDGSGNLYVGAAAALAGTDPTLQTNTLKIWNGTTWATVGGGLLYPTYLENEYNGPPNGVTALTWVESDLYVGGSFVEVVNGVTPTVSETIAKWDGTDWYAIGANYDSAIGFAYNLQEPYVTSIAQLGTNIFAAGFFFSTNWDGTSLVTNGLARFSTVTGDRIQEALSLGWYYPVADGMTAPDAGYGLGLLAFDGQIYLSGLFNQIYTGTNIVEATNIAVWDGISWSGVGTGLGNVADYPLGSPWGASLATDGNVLFVSGNFTTAGSVAVDDVAEWVPNTEGFCTARQIAAGEDHGTLLGFDGTVWGWGGNGYGQVGGGLSPSTYPYVSNPVEVVNSAGHPITNIIAVAAGHGGNHSLALQSGGAIFAWGAGYDYQLGTGSTTDYDYAVSVADLPTGSANKMIAVAAAFAWSVSLATNGTVWQWGEVQIGPHVGTSFITYDYPTKLSGLSNVTAIACGLYHALAVSNGYVCGWGWNQQGQLGNGTTTSAATPVYVETSAGVYLTNVVAIAGGYEHSIAAKSDGSVWAWGSNSDGELGDGGTTSSSYAVQVETASGYLSDVIAVAAGEYHSLALDSNGQLWAWGYNADGELGDGTTTQRLKAVPITTPVYPLSIAGGTAFSLIVGVGEFYSFSSWGSGANGELGNGGTTSSDTPLSEIY